ncbi:hypothetical protein KFK09_012250 [Dendrobium nobile]|uniref:Uncharacterized protein n=1 Tax=Dendrobium nobile TaxID=94219 RepID=A0A8T3BH65_DENNO|nr:hypothetical protein KFK09_012250 [Dendrobium nobile]
MNQSDPKSTYKPPLLSRRTPHIPVIFEFAKEASKLTLSHPEEGDTKIYETAS